MRNLILAIRHPLFWPTLGIVFVLGLLTGITYACIEIF